MMGTTLPPRSDSPHSQALADTTPATDLDRLERAPTLHLPSHSDAANVQKSLVHERTPKKKKWLPSGWRFGILASAIVTAVVGLVNIALAIWLATTRPAVNGTGIVCEAECETIDSRSALVHLLISALSTIMLGASNYCMQCLVAPTREECNEAHRQGHWLDIGVNSVSNVFHIRRWRAVLWVLLALSSLPIHFLYNSVIYKVASANEYLVAEVNEAFWQAAPEEMHIRIPARLAYVKFWDLEPSGCTEHNYKLGDMPFTNLTDNRSDLLDHMLTKCHTTDCSIEPQPAATPALPTSMKDIAAFCGSSVGCYSKETRGVLNNSVTTYDGRYPSTKEWDIWSHCHFSDCPLSDSNGTVIIAKPSWRDVSDKAGSCFALTTVRTRRHNRTAAAAFRQRYFSKPRDFAVLPFEACINEYSKQFVTKWDNLTVVTNNRSMTPEWYSSYDTSRFWGDGESARYGPSYHWLCHNADVRCNFQDWLMFDRWQHNQTYCLAEKVDRPCTLQYNLVLLLIVIACNATKLGVMLATFYWQRDSPLVVVGDAIVSFLDNPDPASRGHCLASDQTLRKLRRRADHECDTAEDSSDNMLAVAVRLTSTQAVRLYQATDQSQLVLTMGAIFGTMAVASGLLISAVSTLKSIYARAAALWTFGNGPIELDRIIFSAQPGSGHSRNILGHRGFVFCTMLSNFPQLIASLLSVLFNGFITSICLFEEWSGYGTISKALRVTTPEGSQRSTYFLHLPYKIGIPLMVCSIVLHWLVSSSLYLVMIDLFKDGVRDPANSITTVGYQPLPILLTILLGMFMLVAAAGLASMKAASNMPVAGSNSLAIAAACHPPKDDIDAARKPVRWGEPESSQHAKIGHCTFTSLPVRAPIAGREYL